jgi:hypothetical protein
MRSERKGKIELIDAPIPFKRQRKAISIKMRFLPETAGLLQNCMRFSQRTNYRRTECISERIYSSRAAFFKGKKNIFSPAYYN